jgi:hypothetical protein
MVGRFLEENICPEVLAGQLVWKVFGDQVYEPKRKST